MTDLPAKCTKKEKVLVTGSGGFIGSHLVESLLEKGYEVICLVKPDENLRWIKDLNTTLMYGDLTKKQTLYESIEGISYVYHLAASLGGSDEKSSDIYDVNYEGSRNLLQACIERGVNLKRFLFVSSVAAVGPTGDTEVFDENHKPNPQSDYGKSKLFVTQYLQEIADIIPYSIVRLPIVYGPRCFTGFYIIFKIVNSGLQLKLRKGETTVGFVKDIVRGIILTAESPKSVGQVYFLGEDKFYNAYEIFTHIAEALGKKTIKIRIPYFILYSFAFCLEILFGNAAPITRNALSTYLGANWRFSTNKAKSELKYKNEYSLAEGLKITANWYKEQGFL
jgi:nucleoside-diphosphate-sugar epimerase